MRVPFTVGRERRTWTLLAAISLGGGAIWSMHFIGMIGYQVADRDLRYNLPLTGVSLLIAVAVSAVGLSLVSRRPDSVARLGAGGVVAGLGVAAMHYTGMAAMHSGSDITYRQTLVIASIAIAIGAALAAMWIAFRVQTRRHVAFASIVMATAVCGMHYTAMAAAQVVATPDPEPVSGADPITLALLVCVLAFSVLAVVIFAALGGVTSSDPFSSARARQREPEPVVPPVVPERTWAGAVPASPAAPAAPAPPGRGGRVGRGGRGGRGGRSRRSAARGDVAPAAPRASLMRPDSAESLPARPNPSAHREWAQRTPPEGGEWPVRQWRADPPQWPDHADSAGAPDLPGVPNLPNVPAPWGN